MGAIEEYLAELDDELRVRLRRRERILAEVRGHLEQRTSEAQDEERLSRPEAEERAVAACGPPTQLVKGFAAEPGGALNRIAVTVSDFSYRVARNRGDLKAAALLTLALLGLAIWLAISGMTTDYVFYLSGLWGLVVGHALQQLLKPAPRPGYVRRWLKLDRAARQQIAAALRGAKAPSHPPASDVAAEVRQRVRYLRRYVLILLPLLFALVGLLALIFVVASGKLEDAGDLGLFLAAALAVLIAVSRWDLRSARRQVEAELAALDVVEEVAGEALRSGTARLQERFSPMIDRGDRFELAPENPNACPVSVEVGKHALTLWLGPNQLRQRIWGRDPDHLRELALYLDAIVAGDCREQARAMEGRRGLPPSSRLHTQIELILETKEGPRRVTRSKSHSKEWEEWWQAHTPPGDDPFEGLAELRFAPYEGA